MPEQLRWICQSWKRTNKHTLLALVFSTTIIINSESEFLIVTNRVTSKHCKKDKNAFFWNKSLMTSHVVKTYELQLYEPVTNHNSRDHYKQTPSLCLYNSQDCQPHLILKIFRPFNAVTTTSLVSSKYQPSFVSSFRRGGPSSNHQH